MKLEDTVKTTRFRRPIWRVEPLEGRTLFSVPGDFEWLQQFGSFGQGTQTARAVAADGNAYVAGEVAGSLSGQTFAGGETDAFVRKYDAGGAELWTRQFGTSERDTVSAVAVDASGVYVAGYVAGRNNLGDFSDAFLRKFDAAGNELWTRTFGTAGTDQATGVAVDASGVYVVGRTTGVLPGEGSGGGDDAFLRKYDVAGGELWTRQFGTTATDQALGVAADASAVYVVGRTNGVLPGQTGGISFDAFVRKYDAGGAELWTRQFGSTQDDVASGVAVDASGVYVAGQVGFILQGQTSAGIADAFVRKYDGAGGVLWTRQFGSASFDGCTGVAVNASGVYLSGSTFGTLPGQASAGSTDAFARKYDAAGTLIWTRQFGGPTQDQALGVAVDATGVYLAGWAQRQNVGAGTESGFLRKFDAGGAEIWNRPFSSAIPGATDAARALGAEGNLFVAGDVTGEVPGQAGAGGQDAFVRAYDVAGNVLWMRQFGTANTDSVLGIAVDDSGVYVTGYSDGAFAGQSNAGGQDVFVRRYDAAGNEVWTRQFGSSGTERGTGVAIDASGVLVAGFTSGALPGQSSAGGQDAFVRKYDSAGNVLWTRQFGTSGTDQGTSIAADAAGVYVAGFTAGAFPGQTIAGFQAAFVRRYDGSGNELWTREFGSTFLTQANSVAVSGSGVYVAGSTSAPLPGHEAAGGQDAFVRKYDAAGNELWTREFGSPFSTQANSIAAGETGVYVAGSTASGLTNVAGALPGQASAGGQDAFVRKYDAGGGEVFTRQFGTSGTDQAAGIAASASDLFVAGSTTGTLPGQISAGGQDAFVARIVDGDNQAPSAGNDAYRGEENLPLTVAAPGVLANDTDADGDAPSTVLANGPAHGTLTLNADGSFTYTPDPQFHGTDSFTYRASDALATSNVATVTITVPYEVDEGSTLTVAAPGVLPPITDPDSNPLFALPVSGPTHGTLTLNPDGSFVYTPEAGFNGTDTFTFRATDGITEFDPEVVTIIVNPVDHPTSTTLASSASPSAFGELVTFTATVGSTGGGAGTPTGTVQFQVDGSDFGDPVPLVGGSASIDLSGLSAEPHTVTAVYSGDASFSPSTSQALNQVVNPATTATAATVSASSPLLGTDGLTLSAVISVVGPGSGSPTGTATFYDGASVLGTVGLVDGAASLVLTSTALGAGSHAIRAVYSGDGNFLGSESGASVNVLAPSAIQGLVYVDSDDDGQVDLGEPAVAGVTVTLTGIDDLGNPVSRTAQTDADGVYAFANLRPSSAAGYTLNETQPPDLLDGRDTPGTVNGVPAGSAAVNDRFSGVVLSRGGSFAENYNFGERAATGGAGVSGGETATIGYWQNRNGQNLLMALNGGPSATNLGRWLAATFPRMYQALDGKTNAEIAAFYKTLFSRTSRTAPEGPPKVDAQLLAVAFAVYVTNQAQAGTTAVSYGFRVSATGAGASTFNVGGNGAAFGVADHSRVSVMALLLAADNRSRDGLLLDRDGDGRISSSEAALRTMANDVFSGINEAGDI